MDYYDSSAASAFAGIGRNLQDLQRNLTDGILRLESRLAELRPGYVQAPSWAETLRSDFSQLRDRLNKLERHLAELEIDQSRLEGRVAMYAMRAPPKPAPCQSRETRPGEST